MKRNVFLLSISRALLIICTSMMITASALVGRALADNKTPERFHGVRNRQRDIL